MNSNKSSKKSVLQMLNKSQNNWKNYVRRRRRLQNYRKKSSFWPKVANLVRVKPRSNLDSKIKLPRLVKSVARPKTFKRIKVNKKASCRAHQVKLLPLSLRLAPQNPLLYNSPHQPIRILHPHIQRPTSRNSGTKTQTIPVMILSLK